jgi:hypothetical protein
MAISIQALVAEHRQMEAALDSLSEIVPISPIDCNVFRHAHTLCATHYQNEHPFLTQLGEEHPAVAAKMRDQHQEVLEIAAHLEESLASGHVSDAAYLTRRFVAMARHNIIEEERDVFPLAKDWLRMGGIQS